MKNTQEATDAAADVFIKLLKKSITFENDEHEKAWLLRTAINHCRNNLKHWWRKTLNIDDYKDLEAAPPGDDHILEVVLALPERYKDVIYLFYYEGYTMVEIAEILQKPQSTIRYHMIEARRSLKELLGDDELYEK